MNPLKMCFLLNMGKFQPAMLGTTRGYILGEVSFLLDTQEQTKDSTDDRLSGLFQAVLVLADDFLYPKDLGPSNGRV